MNQQALFAAILDDDRRKVGEALHADPTLATQLIPEARLFQHKIFHWLYVGDTALHLAAAGHRAEIVGILLAAGADPNACENHRESGPLHYAADGCPGADHWDPARQVATIQCLVDAGAELDRPDKNGATPLHRAVRTRCAAAVRCLLRAGCKPSLKNHSGSTPFHLAVQNTGRGGAGLNSAIAGQREIIEEFLAQGISVRLKDGKGKTVLDWAKSEWVRKLLRR